MPNILRIEGEVINVDHVQAAWIHSWSNQNQEIYVVKYVLGGETYQIPFGNSQTAADAALGLFEQHMRGKPKMFAEVGSDVKGFIKENRQVIYWMALIFLLDHFFFGGAFRDRLKACAEKMIGKVEKQLEAK